MILEWVGVGCEGRGNVITLTKNKDGVPKVVVGGARFNFTSQRRFEIL